ncbi:MAG TPA: hypothetical protein VGW34_10795 [Allosphingosinicella sp.]|nr:hypothetical protein [Allosphingosinicella sp.]
MRIWTAAPLVMLALAGAPLAARTAVGEDWTPAPDDIERLEAALRDFIAGDPARFPAGPASLASLPRFYRGALDGAGRRIIIGAVGGERHCARALPAAVLRTCWRPGAYIVARDRFPAWIQFAPLLRPCLRYEIAYSVATGAIALRSCLG